MRNEGETPEVINERIEGAFGSLASETRLKIVKALLESPDKTATFSELKSRAGVADSGQFSYHLKQLSEYFVQRTDGGYTLRFSGLALYRAMLAGVSTGETVNGAFPTGSVCHECGGELQAEYDSELFVIRCPTCEQTLHKVPFPPGGADNRTREELLAAFDSRTRAFISLAKDGVCPWCSGRTSFDLPSEWCEKIGTELRGHDVAYVCERCDAHLLTTVGENLLTEPAVVSFHLDHGIDTTRTPSWELPFCASEEYVTQLSADPWRARITIPLDDDELTLVVDDRFEVIEEIIA